MLNCFFSFISYLTETHSMLNSFFGEAHTLQSTMRSVYDSLTPNTVTVYTVCCNFPKLNILHSVCVCVFHVIVPLNGDCSPVQN